MSASCPKQTGEIVALKKVALRRLEDGIPSQALREIKALQEIEDSQYVSGAGVLRCWFPPSSIHSHSEVLQSLCSLICFLTPHSLPFFSTCCSPLFTQLLHSFIPSCSLTYFLAYSFAHSLTNPFFSQNT